MVSFLFFICVYLVLVCPPCLGLKKKWGDDFLFFRVPGSPGKKKEKKKPFGGFAWAWLALLLGKQSRDYMLNFATVNVQSTCHGA